MNEITPIPGRGHNGPPSDPLDEALAPYGDDITEAEGWLDGKAVETEGQMKAVDALRKTIREARQAVEKAEEAEAKPLHEAWKAAKARFKPTLDDVSRLEKGLVALVDGFKRKLAAEKAEVERQARIEAAAARAAAEQAMRAADPTNIEAQRAADDAKAAADEATRRAAAASKDTVKGLRAVTETVVLDDLGLARWLWINDREAVLAFNADRARKLKLDLPGVVEQRTERRAV